MKYIDAKGRRRYRALAESEFDALKAKAKRQLYNGHPASAVRGLSLRNLRPQITVAIFDAERMLWPEPNAPQLFKSERLHAETMIVQELMREQTAEEIKEEGSGGD